MTGEPISPDDAFRGMTLRSWADIDSTSPEGRAAYFVALDTMNQTPALRRLKTWAAEQLSLRAGQLAVDVGCGTGADTRELALLVHPGSAIGVDLSETMVVEARRRATALSSSARFEVASAYELPFGDEEVDAIRCERVLQHLAEPGRAVQEMMRVLRPGGRVALIDTDWRTIAIWPGDEATSAAIVRSWLDNAVNPAAASQLADLLIAAGFGHVVLQPDVFLLRLPDAADRPPVTMWVENAVQSGSISADDAEHWLSQVRLAAHDERCVTSVLVMGAAAQRPDT